MPKIGMRIIKSSIAVFVCSCLSYLYSKIPLFSTPENGLDAMVFYSSIAAVICMQPEISNSFKAAKDRILGTLVGGFFALALLFGFSMVPNLHVLLKYSIIALAIIPLILFLVWVKYTRTTLLSCTIFLSVAINVSQSAPLIAATNRMVDTFLGIAVSLGINLIPFMRFKAKDVLFVSDLDGTLLNSKEEISDYSVKKLNYLIKNGAKITIATARTPETVKPLAERVNFNLPIITMNGAATYDLKNERYTSCYDIPYAAAREIINIFDELGCNCFIHTINENHLDIYYSKITNPVEKAFYECRKCLPGKNYINRPLPKNKGVIYFSCVSTLDQISVLYGSIKALACGEQVEAMYYRDIYNEGYYFLEIYSSEASKINATRVLSKEYGFNSIVSFGDNYNDMGLIKGADKGCAVSNAIEKLKKHADCIIESNDDDGVVKAIDQMFFHK